MTILIKNGTVVTASDRTQADLVIDDGKIVLIGKNIEPGPSDTVIDAVGSYVLPGGIDVHTHFDWNFAHLKTADDFESGTRAAAIGGITSIINFTNNRKGNTLLDDLKEWQERASPSAIDYGFHVIVNRLEESVLNEFSSLVEHGATSIKLFMAYKGVFMLNDKEMYGIMCKAGECGLMTNVHAENGDVIDMKIAQLLSEQKKAPIYHAYSRPSMLEAEATHRAIVISKMADAPLYVVHVSSKEAMMHIDRARRNGLQVYGETCPQYLTLDKSYLELPDLEGGKYVCSPPLREKEDQAALWGGISTGTISTIGSDHSPFLFAEKRLLAQEDFSKIPNGVPVVEDLFPIIYHFGVAEGRITINKFVEITSTNPAKIFGMYPQKGTIAVGSDADVVIFDPNQTRTITAEHQFQKVDYNLYEGLTVQGAITHVFSRGDLIVEHGSFVGRMGRGKYIHRQPFHKNAPKGIIESGPITKGTS